MPGVAPTWLVFDGLIVVFGSLAPSTGPFCGCVLFDGLAVLRACPGEVVLLREGMGDGELVTEGRFGGTKPSR